MLCQFQSNQDKHNKNECCCSFEVSHTKYQIVTLHHEQQWLTPLPPPLASSAPDLTVGVDKHIIICSKLMANNQHMPWVSLTSGSKGKTQSWCWPHLERCFQSKKSIASSFKLKEACESSFHSNLAPYLQVSKPWHKRLKNDEWLVAYSIQNISLVSLLVSTWMHYICFDNWKSMKRKLHKNM